LKASFCLEDNDCQGVDPNHDCENYGDQVKANFKFKEMLDVKISGNNCGMQRYLLLQH
jgi:hypothetical protein